MLRPSISRAIRATQDDLLESAELKAATIYGTLSAEMVEWVSTFLVPPPSVFVRRWIS